MGLWEVRDVYDATIEEFSSLSRNGTIWYSQKTFYKKTDAFWDIYIYIVDIRKEGYVCQEWMNETWPSLFIILHQAWV